MELLVLNYTMSVLRGKGKGHGVESNRLSPQPSTAQRERERDWHLYLFCTFYPLLDFAIWSWHILWYKHLSRWQIFLPFTLLPRLNTFPWNSPVCEWISWLLSNVYAGGSKLCLGWQLVWLIPWECVPCENSLYTSRSSTFHTQILWTQPHPDKLQWSPSHREGRRLCT